MKRGEIYFIKSTYTETGSEQRANRPAVIVSNNNNNNNSETVEVVYMTTRPKTDLPTHVFTRSALSPSTILCEQIFTVSKQRIDAQIGALTDSEMNAVDVALAISPGLDFGQSSKQCPSNCHGVAPITREPTEEELKEIAKKMIEEGTLAVPAPEPIMTTDQTADVIREAIKAQAERDVYKELYLNLLAHTKGATNQ